MIKEHAPGRAFAAVLVFWAVLLLGPMVLALWDVISIYSMDPRSIEYLLFTLAAQGIAAAAACYLAVKLAQPPRARVVAVNAIIAATLNAFLIFINAASWQEIVSDVIAVVVLVAGAVVCFQERDEWAKENKE